MMVSAGTARTQKEPAAHGFEVSVELLVNVQKPAAHGEGSDVPPAQE